MLGRLTRRVARRSFSSVTAVGQLSAGIARSRARAVRNWVCSGGPNQRQRQWQWRWRWQWQAERGVLSAGNACGSVVALVIHVVVHHPLIAFLILAAVAAVSCVAGVAGAQQG